jgi:hypothetical protein
MSNVGMEPGAEASVALIVEEVCCTNELMVTGDPDTSARMPVIPLVGVKFVPAELGVRLRS